MSSSETPTPCGSGLARESAGSVTCDVECAGLFASKPAPTLIGGEPVARAHDRSSQIPPYL
ncbi:hypothetical protein FE275_27280 [Pseudomonas koreensis]|nr:hypothetical protein FE275_27280 [Pseudomonas koreensis]